MQFVFEVRFFVIEFCDEFVVGGFVLGGGVGGVVRDNGGHFVELVNDLLVLLLKVLCVDFVLWGAGLDELTLEGFVFLALGLELLLELLVLRFDAGDEVGVVAVPVYLLLELAVELLSVLLVLGVQVLDLGAVADQLLLHPVQLLLEVQVLLEQLLGLLRDLLGLGQHLVELVGVGLLEIGTHPQQSFALVVGGVVGAHGLAGSLVVLH